MCVCIALNTPHIRSDGGKGVNLVQENRTSVTFYRSRVCKCVCESSKTPHVIGSPKSENGGYLLQENRTRVIVYRKNRVYTNVCVKLPRLHTYKEVQRWKRCVYLFQENRTRVTGA